VELFDRPRATLVVRELPARFLENLDQRGLLVQRGKLSLKSRHEGSERRVDMRLEWLPSLVEQPDLCHVLHGSPRAASRSPWIRIAGERTAVYDDARGG
jgi:hypothetical protein